MKNSIDQQDKSGNSKVEYIAFMNQRVVNNPVHGMAFILPYATLLTPESSFIGRLLYL